jgi:large subunit ribosomal protein L23
MTSNKPAPAGLILTPHQVIVRPLLSEKGIHKASRHNQYSFEVNPAATKTDIRLAVEELFNVKVVSVATQNRIGKSRRYRFKYGATRNWKKAVVKLRADHKIELF